MRATRWICAAPLVLAIAACSSRAPSARNPASMLLSNRGGDFVVDGGYDFNVEGIKEAYEDMPTWKFGSVDIKLPTGAIHTVRDMHYPLFKPGLVTVGTGKLPAFAAGRKEDSLGFGMRPIPVADGYYTTIADARRKTSAKNAAGKEAEIVGSEQLDRYLRQAYGYTGADLETGPIYTLIAYMHPEAWNIPFGQLTEHEKLENGMTHLGAYIGNGVTRNAPVEYHGFTWRHAGYPANVTAVWFRGAKDQKTFNTNANISLKFLNEAYRGPRFSDDYMFDPMRAITLKETLDFYRGWLDPSWKRPGETITYMKLLQLNDTYRVYCAEHQTIALNIALNVAQNEQGYQEVWGSEAGAKLWKRAQQLWKKRWAVMPTEKGGNGVSEGAYGPVDLVGIPAGDVNFRPLWKLKGVKTKIVEGKQMGVHDDARFNKIGFSMAWAPETTADIARDFLAQYASWARVGIFPAVGALFGFADPFKQRMGVEPAEFLKGIAPILNSMFRYDAALKLAATPAAGRAEAFQTLRAQYSGGLTQLLLRSPFDDKTRQALAAQVLANPAEQDQVLKLAEAYSLVNEGEARMKAAWDGYKAETNAALAKAREIDIKVPLDQQEPVAEYGKRFVKYYSPPGVVHRAISGIHPYDTANIRLATVATAMAPAELEPLPDGQTKVVHDPLKANGVTNEE